MKSIPRSLVAAVILAHLLLAGLAAAQDSTCGGNVTACVIQELCAGWRNPAESERVFCCESCDGLSGKNCVLKPGASWCPDGKGKPNTGGCWFTRGYGMGHTCVDGEEGQSCRCAAPATTANLICCQGPGSTDCHYEEQKPHQSCQSGTLAAPSQGRPGLEYIDSSGKAQCSPFKPA